MKNKILQLETIGEVHLVKSCRARRLNITIKPFEGIKVSVPVNTGFIRAEEFVLKKEKWIKKNIEKVKIIENGYTIFNTGTNFETKNHK